MTCFDFEKFYELFLFLVVCFELLFLGVEDDREIMIKK